MVIWLDAPEELLLERLNADPTQRPLMQSEDPAQRLAELMGQRRPSMPRPTCTSFKTVVQPSRWPCRSSKPRPGCSRNAAAPQHSLQVVNETGEVGCSIN